MSTAGKVNLRRFSLLSNENCNVDLFNKSYHIYLICNRLSIQEQIIIKMAQDKLIICAYLECKQWKEQTSVLGMEVNGGPWGIWCDGTKSGRSQKTKNDRTML